MLFDQLLHAIMEEGDMVGNTLELMHQNLIVPEECIYDWNPVRPLSKTMNYFQEELAWYLSGDRHHTGISQHASLWEKIQNPDGTLNSNYGHLIFYNKTTHPSMGDVTMAPFDWALKCLSENKESRQGMVTYNTGGYNFEGNKDYICSQHQAFYIRKDVLHCYVALRSSDAIFGLTYNMPWWQFVYQQMWHRLKETYPTLQKTGIKVTIYSAHIYAGHFEMVRRMLELEPRVLKFETELIPLHNEHHWYRQHLVFREDRNSIQLWSD